MGKNRKNYKWLIPEGPAYDREAYWEQTHEGGYDTVFSVTDDPALRQTIINELGKQSDPGKILIPGCGSKAILEQDIAARLAGCKGIVCTDFNKVVAIARKRNTNPAIKYMARNSVRLGLKDKFDAVVIVNSIVSDSDIENREILASCYDALKPGGKLVGLFPTVFCTADLALTTQEPEWLDYYTKNVDLTSFSETEPKQGIKQIFYPPMLLRHIVKEAGFSDVTMGVHFFDSDHFRQEAERLYGIKDPDVNIYEFLVTARKPAAF
jgi:SAM-dependent methyltransferase